MLLAGVFTAVSLVAGVGVARAQEVTPSYTINQTPDDVWMTNGIVYSIVRDGDYIYVGGKFTRAQSAPGGKSFRATNIARFDADTGVGDPTWTPDVTGTDTKVTRVYALAAAGGKIWVGGKFEAVDGIARRNLAAVSPETGEVDPNVDPLVGSETNSGIRAMVASGSKLYIGGYFLQVDNKARRYLAALDFSGNLDATWRPKTDRFVRSMALSCDGATVFAGGKFRNAAGPDGVYALRETVARFDAASGALDPWAIPAGVAPNDAVAADLPVTCERITAVYLGPNLTLSYRLDDGNTGTKAWEKKSGGDVQTAAMLGPDKLVIGGHFGQYDKAKRTGVAVINLSDGSLDPNWAPTLTDPSFVSVWETFVYDNRVYIGGAFKTVEGLPRTNLARFTFS